MSTAEEKLAEKIQHRKDVFAESNADWDTVRADWVSELNSLFEQFEEWLKPLEEKQLLRSELSSQKIQEEDLDPYDAPVLKLSDPSGARVHIQPVGRIVFGARGRVDFLSGGRRVSLLNDENKGWCFRKGSDVICALEPLDNESFFQTISQLLS
ncbi:MAG: hypothetical protein L3J82_07225 [Planctomycetes bacterium]|nr:hypothetical protein [Planctomycetota bacterium]